LYCFYFVIFTWIIKFFQEFAALLVQSINKDSTATQHSTIFLNRLAGDGPRPAKPLFENDFK